MDLFQVRDILDTFRVVVDNREQMTPRAKHRLKALGVPVEHGTLSYGDYAANVDMPDGPLLDTSVTMKPACVIERKMSLDELAACLGRERARFVRELERARDAGAKVYLLVEDASWEKLINHNYRSKLHPNAFMASLLAFQIRYGLVTVFCTQLTSGRMIREILYRELKEGLENAGEKD